MSADFNLTTFAQNIHNIGRNQYFQLEIPQVGTSDIITAMARSTTMPPRTQETIDVYYRGMPIRIDSRATFDTWTVNFLSDEPQQLRNVFLRWMESAYNVSQLENKTGHSVYKRDNVNVFKLQANKEIVTKISFFGMWPTTVGECELTQEGGDIEKFDVTFSYDYWLLGAIAAPDGKTDGQFDINMNDVGLDNFYDGQRVQGGIANTYVEEANVKVKGTP